MMAVAIPLKNVNPSWVHWLVRDSDHEPTRTLLSPTLPLQLSCSICERNTLPESPFLPETRNP